MTTLLKPNGSLVSDLNETVKAITEYLTPKDEQHDNKDYHKRIRALSVEPILTADDRDYTPAEVKKATDDLNHKISPGEDGITGAIYRRVDMELNRGPDRPLTHMFVTFFRFSFVPTEMWCFVHPFLHVFYVTPSVQRRSNTRLSRSYCHCGVKCVSSVRSFTRNNGAM
jgi:hypothetical protein